MPTTRLRGDPDVDLRQRLVIHRPRLCPRWRCEAQHAERREGEDSDRQQRAQEPGGSHGVFVLFFSEVRNQRNKPLGDKKNHQLRSEFLTSLLVVLVVTLLHPQSHLLYQWGALMK